MQAVNDLPKFICPFGTIGATPIATRPHKLSALAVAPLLCGLRLLSGYPSIYSDGPFGVATLVLEIQNGFVADGGGALQIPHHRSST
jgi:hypothetical protein